MEALFTQQTQSNAEAVTKTHSDSAATAAKIVDVTTEVVSVGTQVAASVTDTSKDNETKAAEVTQIAASVVETVPGVAAFTPVIAMGVELEPVIYHGISALIHFFQGQNKAKKTMAGK